MVLYRRPERVYLSWNWGPGSWSLSAGAAARARDCRRSFLVRGGEGVPSVFVSAGEQTGTLPSTDGVNRLRLRRTVALLSHCLRIFRPITWYRMSIHKHTHAAAHLAGSPPLPSCGTERLPPFWLKLYRYGRPVLRWLQASVHTSDAAG